MGILMRVSFHCTGKLILLVKEQAGWDPRRELIIMIRCLWGLRDSRYHSLTAGLGENTYLVGTS